MEFKSIIELLRFVSKADFSEVIVEQGDFRLTIRRGQVVPVVSPAPVVAVPTPPPPVGESPKAEVPPPPPPRKVEYIRSPMVGTFYRRPSPEKEPYVKVGDIVQPGQVVCIIEAMKLFNEIQSEIAGKIVRILVEDGQAVEYDQPLFEVEPLS
ncbi:MAG: acetyl-CoA carboxylase biotin carboxyl carrier protein [Bacteroidia bacterium]|nr:acetyl-CoA carboxylase biotin carboxyl carrier protein [Bacteroidia bacterium]MDW8014773.1 acetyl-CoA carboxylase biotin carboxyl carrier protein [Bacteroidia bacterium]